MTTSYEAHDPFALPAAGAAADPEPAGAPADASDPVAAAAGHRSWPALLRLLPAEDVDALAQALLEERHRRALEDGDPEALMADALASAFTSSGDAVDPYVVDDVLVVPGSIVASSASKHRCRFGNVDDVWIWDHPDLLGHKVRPQGQHSKRTVSLLPLLDGAEVEMITSKASMSEHTLQRGDRWRIDGRSLTVLGSRQKKRPPPQH